MTSRPSRRELSTKIASARQTITLLKSQLEAGMIESDFWMDRLTDLGSLLELVAEQQSSSDQQEKLGALYEVSSVLGSSLDINEVLNQVMDSIIQLTDAERGFLMLFNDETQELEVKVARNIKQETLSEQEFAYSNSVVTEVARTGDQVVTTNAVEDPRFAAQASVVAHSLRSIQCVPLRARGKIIGVVYVDNRIRSGVFDEADLEMLSAFAAQAAIAIENARLFTQTDEELEARVMELSMMQQIDRELNETLDFAQVMDLTLSWAIRVTGADNGAIGLIDLEEGKTTVVAQYGETPATVSSMLTGEMPEEPGSLAVPIQREGRIIGVIALNRDDNQPFNLEAHDFVMRLADHAAIAIENAQLYFKVQAANQAKTEFVSVVTHELRLPMTAIRGYSDMLHVAENLTDRQRRYLETILNNVERMAILVSDLSDIARIESGRLKLDISPEVHIAETLDRVLASLNAQIEEREHKVVIDIAADLASVQADPKRLEQILTNLVSNAYKYTPNGGTITIHAVQEGEFVRCAVSDTGVGMSPEEVSNLFTKFWRAEDRHVRDQPGTGLGLTITKNLIEMQCGEITVESEKGVGTTFAFTLPVTGSASADC
ncbi:MAG: GAF domain-containing protein [Anaerolineae bacterium]